MERFLMNKFIKVWILFIVLFNFSIAQTANGLEILKNDTNGSINVANHATCPMFRDFCKIKFVIAKTVHKDNISVYIENTRYFKYLKLEFCGHEYNNNTAECNDSDSSTNGSIVVGYVYVKSIIVGKSELVLMHNLTNLTRIEVVITEPQRWIDTFHRVYVIVFQVIISIFMGVLLDIEVLKKIIKVPIPVLIGLFCQYGCMPIIAFTAIKIFRMPPLDSLSIFIYGCCPGGAGSNDWTILFDGDIDLSATMTFVSTIGSLVFMPAWIYSLGTIFTTSSNLRIPFLKLLMNLFTTIGPCLLGLGIARIFPKLRPIFLKFAKPVVVTLLFSFLTLTFIAKYYIFFLSHWKQWVIGPIIPTTGFLLGGFVAFIFRLPVKQMFTIGIETGIQNVGVAFFIIIYNFPSPQRDYGMIPLVALSLSTTMSLYIGLLIYTITRKIKSHLEAKKNRNVDEIKDEQTAQNLINNNNNDS